MQIFSDFLLENRCRDDRNPRPLRGLLLERFDEKSPLSSNCDLLNGSCEENERENTDGW
jgi:hypothetical protein